MVDRAIDRIPLCVEIPTMRQPDSRPSISSLISTAFMLSVMLVFIVDLRERARRKDALPAAQAAYENARIIRRSVESTLERLHRSVHDAEIQEIQSRVDYARAHELARKAEYDRLQGSRTGLFW
jgi:hypothetical protein